MRTLTEIDLEIADQKHLLASMLGNLYPRMIRAKLDRLYVERREVFYETLADEERSW